MFDNFDLRATTILKKAEMERYNLAHPYVGTEHLLLSILSEDDKIVKMLDKYGLNYNSFKKELVNIVGSSSKSLDINLYTPMLKKVLDNAINVAKEEKGVVDGQLLLMSLLDEGEGIAIRILIEMDIDIDGIYDELSNSLKNNTKSELNKIGINLNENVDMTEVVIGREREITFLVETLLRRQKNNPILTGCAGVGKTAIVEELARRIVNGNVPRELKNKTIISVNVGSLVAGTKYRGEFEEKLNKIISEVIEDKDIILFIDEIHSISNAGGAEGAVNASDILKPYLARGNFRLIGSTTTEEYNKFIRKDKALERRFVEIKVNEPTIDETKDILYGLRKIYEDYHRITINDDVINNIVELADRYFPYKSNPDKSIDLLDSVCAKVRIKETSRADLNSYQIKLNNIIFEKKENVKKGLYHNALKNKRVELDLKNKIDKLLNGCECTIVRNDILKVIEEKTNIPLLISDSDLIKNVDEKLRERIYGQDEAINSIIDVLNNKFRKNKPISFLLCGPSGVGKTETVKVVAEQLTKSNMIRLDMSEYNESSSINKLIGVSQGYIGYDDEPIFNKVRENPFSIILIDEIEKANTKVLNLFLQILDEGFITNSKGEKINFNNTIIFMTSNIQSKSRVGFGNIVNDEVDNIMSRELAGRIDLIVNYNSIDEGVVRKYLTQKQISNVDEIIKKSEYKKYGLRNIKRLIRE